MASIELESEYRGTFLPPPPYFCSNSTELSLKALVWTPCLKPQAKMVVSVTHITDLTRTTTRIANCAVTKEHLKCVNGVTIL